MSDTAKRDEMLWESTYDADAGVNRLCRVPDMGDEIVRLRRENATLRAAVERVRALHYGRDVSDGLHHACEECEQAYPCPTLRALEGTP